MTNPKSKKELSEQQQYTLLQTLKTRFKKNMHRHTHIAWKEVKERLEAHPEKTGFLHQMEETGGKSA